MTHSCGSAGGADHAQQLVTADQAAKIAIAAANGVADIPPGVMAVVERHADRLVVTFPTRLPPGVRGADYYLQVTVDATSGEITKILGGS